METEPSMNPLPAPKHPLNEEEARRYQLLGEEVARMYPAVCAPGSEERRAFLEVLEEFEDGVEWALSCAWATLDEMGGSNLPKPRSPRLHPSTVVEQLAYILIPDLEFRSTTVREALEFLELEALRIGGQMRQVMEYEAKETLSVVPLVPSSLLQENRVSLHLRHVPLATAFRSVTDAVGLHLRLQEGKLLVCSEDVGKALDTSEHEGHQDPLWELAPYLPPPDLTISAEDQGVMVEMCPYLATPFDETQTRFNAHFLLYGESKTALSLASNLFTGSPITLWPKDGKRAHEKEWEAGLED